VASATLARVSHPETRSHRAGGQIQRRPILAGLINEYRQTA